MAEADNPQTPYDLSAIDRATLTKIVRQIIDSESATVSDWQYDRVHGGAGDVGTVLSGVYRFSGTAQNQGDEKAWSLILKVVGTTAAQDDPSEPRYWKREVLAYQSGQLADLPGDLTSPRFFGIHAFSDRVVGLWLEDVVDAVGPHWPLKQYGLVARHLGQFNGAYVGESALQAWPWLSRGWLREHVASSESHIIKLRQTLDQPLTQRWFIEDDANRILQLWDEREIFFDLLDRLPQTLLHRDAFRRNLFTRLGDDGREQTVAVDWTYVGTGAIGEELVSLVHGTLWFSEIAVANARQLETVVFHSYLEGLADAGWHGDPRLIRLSYTAGSAMCFGLGYFWIEPPVDARPWIEQAFGRPFDETIVLSSEIRHYLLELADETRTLMAALEL